MDIYDFMRFEIMVSMIRKRNHCRLMAENAISWLQEINSWLKTAAHGGIATNATGTRL
jgi:hypothetical protein